jgi:ankyrin repeat protein
MKTAVLQRDMDGVARLLGTASHDIDAFDASGRTALMYAARDPQADARILELLIQNRAKLGLESRGQLDSRKTAVGFAVSGGDPRKVKLLIEAGASIHFRDNGPVNRELERQLPSCFSTVRVEAVGTLPSFSLLTS